MSKPTEYYRMGMRAAVEDAERAHTSKLQTAVSLRDLIISKLASEGIPGTISNFGTVCSWTGRGLDVVYRSPKRPMPEGKNLEYGLDVWKKGKGKVFNIEWNEDSSKVDIVRFNRGVWEKSFE